MGKSEQIMSEISDGDATTAIDEGVINSMALATWVDDKTIDVTIINGRNSRAIKRQRNRAVDQLKRKISRCKNGSYKHRRLIKAKKKVQSKAKLALRDFDHQVSHKAANHVITHRSGAVVPSDVRGIECYAKKRIGRHSRQQLSQCSRGIQERYLQEKTQLELVHQDECYFSQTCPMCKTHKRGVPHQMGH